MLNNKPFYPNMLLVGGSKRNVGKTTLICRIIEKISKEHPVIALKATSIRQNEEQKHGYHENNFNNKWEINQERDYSGTKDTSKMLLAGAEKAFYIRAEDKYLDQAFNEFYHSVNASEYLLIAESAGLRFILKPSVFLLLKFNFPHELKNSFLLLEKFADLILLSDGEKIISEIPEIRINKENMTIKLL